MRLFDYAVRNAAPIRLALDRHERAGRATCGSSARTRSSTSAGTSTCTTSASRCGDRRRQPRHPAGLLPRRPRLGPRASWRRRSTGRCASRCSPAARRSPTAASATSRCRNALDAINGADPLRRARHPARRCDGDAGRRAGPVRRPHRLRRLPAGRARRHRARRGHAPAVSRGHAVDGRRRPRRARQRRGADARRHRSPCKNAIWNRPHRPDGRPLRSRPARRSAPARRRRRAAPPRRCRCGSTCRCVVPSTLRVENNLARLVASADLQLRGTYDRPLLFGRAEVDRGEVTFEGRRYLVTRGAIDFTNPTRIEPFFDIEAETRVRVPGQTYRVTVARRRHARAAAADARIRIRRCPTADVLALLFSDVGATADQDVELRALQNPNQRAAATSCASARRRRSTGADLVGGRPRGRADLRRRHLSADAVAGRSHSQQSTRLNPSARAHDRQADLRSRLPDLLAQPGIVDATIRSSCSNTTRPTASRGFCRATRTADLRARRPGEARLLMACGDPRSMPQRVLCVLCASGCRRPARGRRRRLPRQAGRRRCGSIDRRPRDRPTRLLTQIVETAVGAAAVDGAGARDDRAPVQPRPLRGRAASTRRSRADGVALRYELVPIHPVVAGSASPAPLARPASTRTRCAAPSSTATARRRRSAASPT